MVWMAVLPPAIYTHTDFTVTLARHELAILPETLRRHRQPPLPLALASAPDLIWTENWAGQGRAGRAQHVCFGNTASVRHISRLDLEASPAVFVMHLPALACALINAGLPNSRLVRDATPPPYRPPRRLTSHHTSRLPSAISPWPLPCPFTDTSPPQPLVDRSAIGMDAGSVTGGLAAGSHMRDELHVMRAREEVSSHCF